MYSRYRVGLGRAGLRAEASAGCGVGPLTKRIAGPKKIVKRNFASLVLDICPYITTGEKSIKHLRKNKNRNNTYLFIFYSLYKISSRIVHEKIFVRLN